MLMKKRGVLLYVDDSRSVSWLVKRFFEMRYPAYEIIIADSAALAVHELEAREGHEDFPKALITDLQLGGAMDGTMLIQQIRSHFPKLRAIVVSGSISAEDRERSYGAGANAVIEKPTNLDHFVSRIFDLIQCPTDTIGC